MFHTCTLTNKMAIRHRSGTHYQDFWCCKLRTNPWNFSWPSVCSLLYFWAILTWDNLFSSVLDTLLKWSLFSVNDNLRFLAAGRRFSFSLSSAVQNNCCWYTRIESRRRQCWSRSFSKMTHARMHAQRVWHHHCIYSLYHTTSAIQHLYDRARGLGHINVIYHLWYDIYIYMLRLYHGTRDISNPSPRHSPRAWFWYIPSARDITNLCHTTAKHTCAIV